MKLNLLITIVLLGSAHVLFAQDGTQTRSITSDDFVSQRPPSTEATGKKPVAIRRKPVRYKFVRSDKNVVRARPPKNVNSANTPEKVTEIGLTLWRLRPPRRSESGAFLLPVLDDNQERRMWLAERVPIDTVFNAGDRIRFAVESSDAGYIYVFGREMYSDGSFGTPYTVFAGSKTDSSVRPGMLFDIPDQREDLPYLKINPKKKNYVGELLTIIISPKPSEELALDKNGELRNGDNLSALEFGSEVEIFSRTDAKDTIFTKAEADASCGVKTRELVREQPGTDPCTTRSRELTRDEVLPQTIYRVKAQAGKPAVAFVKLSVRGS